MDWHLIRTYSDIFLFKEQAKMKNRTFNILNIGILILFLIVGFTPVFIKMSEKNKLRLNDRYEELVSGQPLNAEQGEKSTDDRSGVCSDYVRHIEKTMRSNYRKYRYLLQFRNMDDRSKANLYVLAAVHSVILKKNSISWLSEFFDGVKFNGSENIVRMDVQAETCGIYNYIICDFTYSLGGKTEVHSIKYESGTLMDSLKYMGRIKDCLNKKQALSPEDEKLMSSRGITAETLQKIGFPLAKKLAKDLKMQF